MPWTLYHVRDTIDFVSHLDLCMIYVTSINLDSLENDIKERSEMTHAFPSYCIPRNFVAYRCIRLSLSWQSLAHPGGCMTRSVLETANKQGERGIVD